MLAPPIVPGRYQPSIVSACELNFCVRNGNRCTLTAIGTNYVFVNLTNRSDTHGSSPFLRNNIGDPCGTRTHVNGVRGRCLNRLTNGPNLIYPIRDSMHAAHNSDISPAHTTATHSNPEWSQPLKIWCTIRDSNPGHPD